MAWQPIGISMGVYDMCHRYLSERKQFGAPLAAFQLNQQKLVQMLGNVQAMILMGWRLCKLYDADKMTIGQAGLGKVGLFWFQNTVFCFHFSKAIPTKQFPKIERK